MQDLVAQFVEQLDTVAVLMLILAITTALKKYFRRMEYDGEASGWIHAIARYARKVLEFASANDGDAEEENIES